jgi:hypothetical protein
VPAIERERLSMEEGVRKETGDGHAAGSGEASKSASTDASTDSSLRVGFGDANMGRFRDRMQEQPSNDLLCSLLGCVFMAVSCYARPVLGPFRSRLACVGLSTACETAINSMVPTLWHAGLAAMLHNLHAPVGSKPNNVRQLHEFLSCMKQSILNNPSWKDISDAIVSGTFCP